MATIGKRLLQIIPTVFLVTLATFLLVDLIPGDPAYAILGENATPEAVAALHHQLRLDDPLPVRYVHWLGDAVTGDLGTSIRSNRPVTSEFTDRLPVTLELAVLAILIGLVVGIPLGMWSAWREGRLLDRTSTTVSFAVVSLPSFLLGVFLVYLLALRFEVFPVTGWERLSDGLGANLRHAFLPALTLGLAEAAVFSQLLRVDMVATLNEDFVAAARAKGLPAGRILVHHALRPSSQSLLALAGVNFGRLLGGTVIVEQLFGLPGVGTLIITSIPSKDMPVEQGSVLVIAIAYVVLNLLVDIAAVAVDPRLRRVRA
jgi:peptide/nickel transport system permease protein